MDTTSESVPANPAVVPDNHKIFIERIEEGHWHMTRGKGEAMCCGSAGRTMKLFVKTMMEIDPALMPPSMTEENVSDILGAQPESQPEEEDTSSSDDANFQQTKKAIVNSGMRFDHFLAQETVKFSLIPSIRTGRLRRDQKSLDLVRASYAFDQPTAFYCGMLAALLIQLVGMQGIVVKEAAKRALAKLQGQPDPGSVLEDYLSIVLSQATVIDEYLLKNNIDIVAS